MKSLQLACIPAVDGLPAVTGILAVASVVPAAGVPAIAGGDISLMCAAPVNGMLNKPKALRTLPFSMIHRRSIETQNEGFV
jgi:hypothetical protein